MLYQSLRTDASLFSVAFGTPMYTPPKSRYKPYVSPKQKTYSKTSPIQVPQIKSQIKDKWNPQSSSNSKQQPYQISATLQKNRFKDIDQEFDFIPKESKFSKDLFSVDQNKIESVDNTLRYKDVQDFIDDKYDVPPTLNLQGLQDHVNDEIKYRQKVAQKNMIQDAQKDIQEFIDNEQMIFNYKKIYSKSVSRSEQEYLRLLENTKQSENQQRIHEFYKYDNIKQMVLDSLNFKLEQLNMRGTTEETEAMIKFDQGIKLSDEELESLIDPPSDCENTVCLKDISVDAYLIHKKDYLLEKTKKDNEPDPYLYNKFSKGMKCHVPELVPQAQSTWYDYFKRPFVQVSPIQLMKQRMPFIRRNDGEMEDPNTNPPTAGPLDCDTTEPDQMKILMSDYFKSFKQLVESKGFAYECHTIQTADGYILNMFRIQQRRFIPIRKKPAVFLQHGMLSSADTWVINQHDTAPAFQLASQGYDVWLGNSRGSKYGRSHVYLDPDSKQDREKFWSFSFADMGKFDAPEQVDYVRKYTQQEKITYIGHSQGTTQLFYAMSKNPDFWADRLNLFISIAPVVYIDHSESPMMTFMSRFGNRLEQRFEKVGLYEVFGQGWDSQYGWVKRVMPMTKRIKINSDMMNIDLDDDERVRMLMGHFPHGTSVRSLNHFGQLIKNKEFTEYDYKKQGNIEKYGSKDAPTVPLANLQNAGVPLAMFAGQNDGVVPFQGNRRLMEFFVGLENNPLIDYFEVPEFDHMTFLLGKDMSYFNSVLELVNQYNKMDLKGRQKEGEKKQKEKLDKTQQQEKKLEDLLQKQEEMKKENQMLTFQLQERHKMENLELERNLKIKEIKLRRRIERLQLQKLNNQKQYYEIVKERYERFNNPSVDVDKEIEKNEEMIKEEIKRKIDQEEQDIQFFKKMRLMVAGFNNREQKPQNDPIETVQIDETWPLGPISEELIQYKDIIEKIEDDEENMSSIQKFEEVQQVNMADFKEFFNPYENIQIKKPENKRGFRNAFGLFNRFKKPIEVDGTQIIREGRYNDTFDWIKLAKKSQIDV